MERYRVYISREYSKGVPNKAIRRDLRGKKSKGKNALFKITQRRFVRTLTCEKCVFVYRVCGKYAG